MPDNLIPIPSRQLARAGLDRLPAVIVRAGEKAAWRFIEFFTANIRNKNTLPFHRAGLPARAGERRHSANLCPPVMRVRFSGGLA